MIRKSCVLWQLLKAIDYLLEEIEKWIKLYDLINLIQFSHFSLFCVDISWDTVNDSPFHDHL